MQRLRPVAVLPARRVLVRFVTLDYVGYLFLQAGTNALPVLVTTVLGTGANAVFYVGWLLGGSMELVADHFGMSLTVESAANPARLATYTRQVLRKGLLLFVPGAVLLCACAPVLLAVFGARYAQDSSTVLRLFTIAVVPKFVVDVFVAACRVQQRVGLIVLIQATTAVLVVSISVFAMRSVGVAGVGVAYLACQLVVAVAVLPALVRLLRGGP
jgi:O-antigen/teichoic acid export membrane protein